MFCGREANFYLKWRAREGSLRHGDCRRVSACVPDAGPRHSCLLPPPPCGLPLLSLRVSAAAIRLETRADGVLQVRAHCIPTVSLPLGRRAETVLFVFSLCPPGGTGPCWRWRRVVTTWGSCWYLVGGSCTPPPPGVGSAEVRHPGLDCRAGPLRRGSQAVSVPQKQPETAPTASPRPSGGQCPWRTTTVRLFFM